MNASNRINDTLRVKLRTTTLLQFDEALSQRYVPLDGANTAKASKCFDLRKKILTEFLGNEKHDVLLLQGKAGMGKTWFTQALVDHLWQQAKEDSYLPIPLWIPLIGIEKPHIGLLDKHFRKLSELQRQRFHPSDSVLTKRDYLCLSAAENQPDLIIVLDGWDELTLSQRKKNIYQGNGFNQWKGRIQVIVTSRREALTGNYKPYLRSGREGTSLFECHVQTFTKNKIPEVIAKFVKFSDSSWQARQYEAALEMLHDDDEHLTQPFSLYTLLTALPVIVADIDEIMRNKYSHRVDQDTQWQHLFRQKLVRHNIYKTFMKRTFERESGKIKAILNKTDALSSAELETRHANKPLAHILEDYTSTLAQLMFAHRVNTVTWVPKEPKDTTMIPDYTWDELSILPQEIEKKETVDSDIRRNLFSTESYEQMPITKSYETNAVWLRSFFEDETDEYLPYIRRGSPLIYLGDDTFSFWHQSILTFYAAQHLFDSVLHDGWRLTKRNINNSNLQCEPTVLQALVKRVHNEPVFEHILFAIIDQSKHEPYIWRAAANAITILNRANVSFTGKDFRRIRIGGEEEAGNYKTGWGADLSNALLINTNLAEADLRYVRFYNTQLTHANMLGACLDGAKFGASGIVDGDFFDFSAKGDRIVIVKHIPMGWVNAFRNPYQITCLSWPQKTRLYQWNIKIDIDIIGIALSPDGSELATLLERDPVTLWDMKTGDKKQLSIFTTDLACCISYAPSGEELAVGMSQGVQLWDVKKLELKRLLPHESSVIRIAYSPQGNELVAVSKEDNTISVWCCETWKKKYVLSGHESKITSIAYAPSGNELASGSENGTIRLWHTKTGEEKCVLFKLKPKKQSYRNIAIKSIAYASEGDELATTYGCAVIKLWDLLSGKQTYRFDTCPFSTVLAKYSPDNLLLSVGEVLVSEYDWTFKKYIRIWNLEQKKYKSDFKLCSDGLNVESVTGLKRMSYAFLKYKSHHTPLIGKPAPKSRSSAEIIKAREQQLYIRENCLEPWLDDGNGSYQIDKQQWLLSLVREKEDELNSTSVVDRFGGHTWLLLQGLTNTNYSVVREFHLYRDTQQSWLSGGTVGRSVIVIRDLSPYELFKKSGKYEVVCWMVTKEEAKQLENNINNDREKGVNYLLTGREPGIFKVKAYSCISWCEKHLSQISIDPLYNRSWSDSFVAIPQRYFPKVFREENVKNEHTREGCLTM